MESLRQDCKRCARRGSLRYWDTLGLYHPLRHAVPTIRRRKAAGRATRRMNGGMPCGREGRTFHLSHGHQLGTYGTCQLRCPASQPVRRVGQSLGYPTLTTMSRRFNDRVSPPEALLSFPCRTNVPWELFTP